MYLETAYFYSVRKDLEAEVGKEVFYAYCCEIPTCTGRGGTVGEAVQDAQEAVRRYQMHAEKLGLDIPNPKSIL